MKFTHGIYAAQTHHSNYLEIEGSVLWTTLQSLTFAAGAGVVR